MDTDALEQQTQNGDQTTKDPEEGAFSWLEACHQGDFVGNVFTWTVLGLWVVMCAINLSATGLFILAERQNEIDNYEKALAAHRVQNKLVMDALQALNATSGANQTAIAALHTFASGNLATPKDPQNWRFWRAMLFAWTLASTVGYGSFAPVTQLGRGLTCILIPFLVVSLGALMGYIGTQLTAKLRAVTAYIGHHSGFECKFQQAVVVMVVSFTLGTLYCIFFAGISLAWQDMDGGINMDLDEPSGRGSGYYTFLDCFYYASITFTTIGLGDITAPAHTFELYISDFFFLTVGLILVANIFGSCFEVVAQLGEKDKRPEEVISIWRARIAHPSPLVHAADAQGAAAAETAEREARHPDGGRHPRFSDTQGGVELRMIREGEEAGSSRQEGPMAGAGIDKGASVLSASEDTLLNEIESELLNEAEAQLPNATGP